MQKKGFTLVELLAVIIILGIIAIIAVPIITNIVLKARRRAAEDSAYSIINAAELYYTNVLLEYPASGFLKTKITFTQLEEEYEFKEEVNGEWVNVNPPSKKNLFAIKGAKPTSGAVIIDVDGKAEIIENARTAGKRNDYLVIDGFYCYSDNDEMHCYNDKQEES